MTSHAYSHQEEKFPLSFSDLFFVLRHSKRTIYYWALAIGMVSLLFALTRPIYYQAEATFREKSMKSVEGGASGSLLQLLSSGSLNGDQEALSVFSSYKLLSKVIEQLGLQARLEAQADREGVWRLIKNNAKLAWAACRRQRRPVLEDFSCPLKISELVYKGEIPLAFLLKMKEKGSYELFDLFQAKRSIGEGKWGEVFEWEGLSFILDPPPSPPSSPLPETFYLTISSLPESVKELIKHLELDISKSDKNLVKLKYKHRDRHLASAVLNTAMSRYQDFIKSHHDRLAIQQLDYLSVRRGQLKENLTEAMQQHAHFLTHDLYSAGFIETDKEMEFLAKSQHEYKQRLLDKDLEIKRLEQVHPGHFVHYDHYQNEGDPTVINTILGELRTLKQQKEGVEIELLQKSTALSALTERASSEDYRGMTLEGATELYHDYSKQHIQMESTVRQMLFFIHQMEDPSFEISSLSAGLTDPISLEIIRKAGELVLNLKDQNNQSPREQERIKEELSQERIFLSAHLQQMVQLMKLNQALLNEKIVALQQVSLDLIRQRMTLLEKNLQEYLQSRLHNLHQERELIKAHLENIHSQMMGLPKKWAAEKLIEQEVETNELIVEEIAKLVESKNISHHLEVIQSAPLDFAFPPLHPFVPKALLWSVLGGLLGTFFGFGAALVFALREGIPVSAAHLEERGYHVSGTLVSPLEASHSLLHNQDLETLRRLQASFDFQTKTVPLLLLLEGEGPHYASHLALLFLKRGKRVLILDLDFTDRRNESSAGLLQYLLGEISYPCIEHTPNGDRLAAGGYHPFANEMVASPLFQQLVEQLKQEYDLILAVSRVLPCSVEAETLLPLFHRAVVTISREKTNDLAFYDRFLAAHPQDQWSFILAVEKEHRRTKEGKGDVLRRYYRDLQQSTRFAQVLKFFKGSKQTS